MPKVKSVQELERELEAKKTQLGQLETQRKQVARKLDGLDRQIAALTGASAPAKPARGRKPGGKPGRKPGRKPGPKPGPKPAVAAPVAGPRAAGKPLIQYIREILVKADGGVRAKDVSDTVLAAGYPTRSKNFYNTVATMLATEKEFKRIKRGVYTLAKK